MEILQMVFKEIFVERFIGIVAPKTGGRFVFVVNVYHLLVYRPLPVGSVAFTQTFSLVKFASPESVRVFVPLDALVPLVTCVLLHWMVHVKGFPSESLMRMLQVRFNRFPMDPFVGVGVPNTGGLFV
jgi:hypothetical protein